MRDENKKLPIGLLISGRGTNMEALIAATEQTSLPARINLVVSNNPDAAGLATARAKGLKTAIVNHRDFPDRKSFEQQLTATLEGEGVEFVCNAGFMRILTSEFVDHWHNRHLNIHPSLLPSYRGLDTHARVLADGGRITGCTVHFVREAMDEGPIVCQAAVKVAEGDTAETLAARVLKAEHRIYPQALAMIATGAYVVEGERVLRTGQASSTDKGRSDAPLISPTFKNTDSHRTQW